MTQDPFITTIITTYRRPQLLRRALSSVLNQTCPFFQVCVYDNASGDETRDVVEEFIKMDSRVKYHCHSSNIGMMGNYEFALNEVKTPFFSLLSDDDVLLPCFYEEGLKGLEKHPEAAFFAGSTIIMTEVGKVIRVPLDLWSREGYFSAESGVLEMIAKYPVPTAVLFQKKVIDVVPIDMQNALMWDCDFLLQIAARYPIVINKKPCAIFLHHEDSYSNAQSFINWQDAQKCILNRLVSCETLSEEFKKMAIELMSGDLRSVNRAFVLRSFFAKNFDQGYQFASIYHKKYGLNSTSILLLTICKLCKYLPFAFTFFTWVRRLRKKLMHRRAASSYEFYAKWLS